MNLGCSGYDPIKHPSHRSEWSWFEEHDHDQADDSELDKATKCVMSHVEAPDKSKKRRAPIGDKWYVRHSVIAQRGQSPISPREARNPTRHSG
jgi:hypothetical protein